MVLQIKKDLLLLVKTLTSLLLATTTRLYQHIAYDPSIFSEGRLQKIEKVKQEDDKQLSAAVELLLIYALKQLDEEVSLPLQVKEEESGNLLLESKVKVNGEEIFRQERERKRERSREKIRESISSINSTKNT